MDVSKTPLDCGSVENSAMNRDVITNSNGENDLISEIWDLPREIQTESEKFYDEINAMKDVAKEAYRQFDTIIRKFQHLEDKVTAIKALVENIPVEEFQGIRDNMNSIVIKAEKDMLDIRSTVNSFPASVTSIKTLVNNVLHHLDMYKLPKRKTIRGGIYHIYSPIRADESTDQDTSYEDIESSSSFEEHDLVAEGDISTHGV